MIPECKHIRQEILKIAHKSGHGHIPTCFSVIEILYAIYTTIQHNPKDPTWPERDIFILSKGHASLAHYAILAHFGYFPMKNVYTFGAFQTDFGCHADRKKIPGIEASTGSLAHGIGIAVGIALGLQIQKSSRNVYVLIGDGESNEGSVWEAAMVATNLRLSNLTIIYDDNRSHSRGLQIKNPAEKFKAFNCDVTQVDGHDVGAIQQELRKKTDNVRVIVASTKKGYGCKTFIDCQYEWHRKSPCETELELLMGELDEKTV